MRQTKKSPDRKKRCPNGTRRDKKTGVCLPQRLAPKPMPTKPMRHSPNSSAHHLSENEIDELMRMNNLEGNDNIRELLRTLTFDEKYVSCFSEKQKTLFLQANAKLQCWNKYGDIF